MVKIIFGDPPSIVKYALLKLKKIKNKAKVKKAKNEAKEVMKVKFDTEKYIVIVFSSREEKNKVLESLGLPPDERYIFGDFVKILPKEEIEPVGIKSAPRSKSGATG